MTLRANSGDRPPPLDALFADRLAFRHWYDDVLPLVYRFIVSRCGHDAALAREVTGQTFLDAIRYRHQFEGRSDVVSWLCAIGRAKLIDHYRHPQRGGDDIRRQPTSAEADAARDHDERSSVETALARLPGEQRLVLVLRYLDGFSVRELAEAFGRSETDANALLFRAREAFRRAYSGEANG